MRLLVAAFWLSAVCFYAGTGTGHSSFSDGFLLFLTARNYLDTGSFAVPPPAPGTVLTHHKVGVDGQSYVSFGPGLVFAHLPTILVGRSLPTTLQPRVNGQPANPLQRDEFWAQLTNAWIMATAVTFILLCGRALGFSIPVALSVAVAAAIASPLWLYARIDSTEALQALALIGAFYLLLRGRTTDTILPHMGAGLFLGIAVTAKVANLILVPWYIFYCLRRDREARRRMPTLLFFLSPALFMVGLVGLYNHVRFRNPLESGYDLTAEGFTHPMLDGIYHLLASPSYGLIVFWPAFLVALFGLAAFFRRFPDEGILACGVFVTLLAVYAKWWAFWGLAWGPRFLIPALPLLSLLLLPAFQTVGHWRKGVILLLLAAGCAVQLIAVGTGYWTQVMPTLAYVRSPQPERLVQDPAVAPLRVGAWLLRATFRDHAFGETRTNEFLEKPPWHEAFPWRDRSLAVQEVRKLCGLDLWAAPKSLRLSRIYVPPPEDWVPIPSSDGVRILLLSVGILAGLVLLREILGSPSS